MRRGPTRSARCKGPSFARACLVGVVLTSALAIAAPTVVLIPVVPGEGVPPDAAERVTKAVALQLDAADAVRPWAAKKSAADPLAPALAEARRLVAKRKFPQARSALTQALTRATSGDSGASPGSVVQAELLLGALDLRAGNERAAKEAFDAAVGIEPAARLPRNEFPPVVAREVDRARVRVSHGARTKVSFDGPAGTEIQIDGHRLGTLPGAVAKLAAGPHRIDATSSEGQLSLWFEIAGSSLALPLVFAPNTSPTAGVAELLGKGVLTDELAQQLQTRLKGANADAALVAQLGRREVGLVLSGAVYTRGGFTLLTPLTLDAGLHTVDAQALKLVDALSATVRGGGEAAVLPIDLATGRAPQASPPAIATTPVKPAPQPKIVEVIPAAPTLTPHPPAEKPFTATEPVATADDEGPGFFSRVPTWAWIAGGVVLAAGAGGATYYAVSRANRPATGTVAATW